MNPRKQPERVRIDDAAAILGIPVRTVQALAARGEIPAAKVGRLWTFNPERLRNWLLEKEAENSKKSTRMTARRKPIDLRLPSRASEEDFERAIGRLRSKGPISR